MRVPLALLTVICALLLVLICLNRIEINAIKDTCVAEASQ